MRRVCRFPPQLHECNPPFLSLPLHWVTLLAVDATVLGAGRSALMLAPGWTILDPELDRMARPVTPHRRNGEKAIGVARLSRTHWWPRTPPSVAPAGVPR